MSYAWAPSHQGLDKIVNEAFVRARQGAVLMVDAKGLQPPRSRELHRRLIDLMPEGTVHAHTESQFVILVRHVGVDDIGLLAERIRRHLAKDQWEEALVGSGCWSVTGSTPMEAAGAALAAVSELRGNRQQDLDLQEAFLDLDGATLNWVCAGEFLSG